jgi:hypothetical protein
MTLECWMLLKAMIKMDQEEQGSKQPFVSPVKWTSMAIWISINLWGRQWKVQDSIDIMSPIYEQTPNLMPLGQMFCHQKRNLECWMLLIAMIKMDQEEQGSRQLIVYPVKWTLMAIRISINLWWRQWGVRDSKNILSPISKVIPNQNLIEQMF